MFKNRKNGFTLVELLAVIAILALILIIAVPKVQDTMEESRKRTLELSVKSIAKSAEEVYMENESFGITDEITCEGVANISSKDYQSCEISFDDDGNARVTYVGKGSYDGLWVCNGTKTKVIVANEECKNCLLEYEKINYTVKDYDSCINYTSGLFYDDQERQTFCHGNPLDYGFFYKDLLVSINDGLFTKEELIENNVINIEIENACPIDETPLSCFETGKVYEVKDYDSCINYTKEVFTSTWGYTDEEHQAFCREEVVDLFSFTENIKLMISDYDFIEEELMDNNVIKISDENISITDYDTSCSETVIIPSKIDGKNIVEIGADAFKNKNISAVKIPASVNKIGSYAFFSNPLMKVMIENRNATIGSCAFEYELFLINDHNIPSSYQCYPS